MSRKACQGDETITVGNFEECAECELSVRFDLVNHPFFGFQSSCPNYEPPEPDGEAFRGGEAAGFRAEQQAQHQRDLKR